MNGTSAAQTTSVVAGATLRKAARNPRLIVTSIGLPIVLMFLLLSIFGEVAVPGGRSDYIDRLLPLILLIATSFTTMPSAAAFHHDLQIGLVARLRSLPVPQLPLLAGRVAGDALRALVVAPVITAAAYLAGFRFEEGLIAAAGFFALVMASGAMFGWVAAAIALRGRSPEAIAGGLDPTLQLLTLLSTGIVPVDAFPSFLQPVVRMNPFSRAVEALVGLSSGGPIFTPLAHTAAWIAVVAVVAATLATRAFGTAATTRVAA